MVYLSPESAYMRLMKDLLAKKQRLVVDEWGADDSKPEVRAIYEPLERLIIDNIDVKYRKCL